MAKVYLGGTCNESTWREKLISLLTVDYFNPVVEDWNEKAQQEELKQREISDFCLYVITPKMTGSYGIAELIDDSNKRPEKTLFCFLHKDDGTFFTESQIKSMTQIAKMVERNGGKWLHNIQEVANYLNQK